MDIINELKRESVTRLLEKNERLDGRALDEYRRIEVHTKVFENSEGSAHVRIGKTQVLGAVKFGIAAPFADKPDEGVFSVGAELAPLGSFMFEPGPPSPSSIELARVTDRGIRSAEIIDTKSFFLEAGKALALYLDIYVIDNDGNLFDAASLAGMAALLNTKMPKVEEGKIIAGEYAGQLPVTKKAVSCTFAKIGEKFLLDPSLDEMRGMDTRLTVSTLPDCVCAMQKGEWGALKEKEIVQLIELSFKKGEELRSLI